MDEDIRKCSKKTNYYIKTFKLPYSKLYSSKVFKRNVKFDYNIKNSSQFALQNLYLLIEYSF